MEMRSKPTWRLPLTTIIPETVAVDCVWTARTLAKILRTAYNSSAYHYMPQPSSEYLRVHLEHGLRAQREGRLESARDACLRALAAAPDHPEALNLLGTIWLQLGDPARAVECFERAARKLRNHPGVLGNLAQAYFALAQYGRAKEAFRKASRLVPRNAHFQVGVANSLAMQGQLSDAEIMLRKLADRFPGASLVWFNLGNVLRDQGRLEEAVPCYVKALEIDPRLVDARNNLGGVWHALYRFEEAEREYRACIALAPDYAAAQYNLASVVIDRGRFREAEDVCREIIQRDPAATRAHTFLGAALGHQGRLLEALECHRSAAELAPQDAKVAEIYAAALADVGDFSGALRGFARALALEPDSTSARQLLGTALLSHGCLTDGWVYFAYRTAFIRFREKYPDVQLSRTLPPELHGSHIFLLREQGLGDEVFFLRFARLLSAAGARVTYRASDKLRGLLSRVACLEQVVEETAPAPQADAVMMVGDLPHALSDHPANPLRIAVPQENEMRAAEFPPGISLFCPPVPPTLELQPLQACLAAVRRRLTGAGSPPYIGLSWQAGTAPEEQRGGPAWSLYKKIGIEPLAEALRDLPGTFIALQRNPGPGEIEAFSRILGRRMHDFSALNEDLESMAALLALIDEYIGVSNTNMHLRAAVGGTARVLVPCPAEWRWMNSGRSSPWFPGFQIYRQDLNGGWDAAFTQLAQDLQEKYGKR